MDHWCIFNFGEISTIVVSSPEFAREIYKTHDIIFSQRARLLSSSIVSYNFVDVVFSPYGDYWGKLSKICTVKLLSPKRVQTFRSIREEEVLNMIKSIVQQKGSRSSVNLSRKIFSLTYGITAQAAFGKTSNHQDQFLSLINKIVKLLGGFGVVDWYPSIKLLDRISGMRRKLEKVHKQIDVILQSIVDEHKEKMSTKNSACGEMKDDLVDVLLNIKKREDFEPD